eukprot:1657010-Karenia_brevis.AAC.1
MKIVIAKTITVNEDAEHPWDWSGRFQEFEEKALEVQGSLYLVEVLQAESEILPLGGGLTGVERPSSTSQEPSTPAGAEGAEAST